MSKKTTKKKVLILEDEKALANLYMKKLQEAGFEVRLFASADEMLKACSEFSADVALLDHALHGAKKSGLDVIPALRKCNPKIKIAMLSNYSQFQMGAEAKQAGADDYLLKIDTSPATLVKYVQGL